MAGRGSGALAGRVAQVGVVAWFAGKLGGMVGGIAPTLALVVLVAVFFLAHYVFASITAHVTALLPVMLTVGKAVPGMDMQALTLSRPKAFSAVPGQRRPVSERS